MEHGRLIYFDNAATTYPKPRSVIKEIVTCMAQDGGNAGRGSHSLAMAAANKIFECRVMASELFGVDDPARVIFTLNTTLALNTVIKGLMHNGDHALISDMEHNAVYRPFFKMQETGIATFDTFRSMTTDPARNATRICAGIARHLKSNTRMLVCTHTSNICSATLPISEIGSFCHRHGILFILDGAQSAGHETINVDEMNIDALCIPGHKGLYGPQGCGMILLGKNILPETLFEGGSGVNSLDGNMPALPPERYEAGTLPTAVIAGVCEGMRAVRDIGTDAIREHEISLYRHLREMLGNTKGVTLYAPEYEGSTLLFNLDGVDSETTGRMLNDMGICVRSGYHCAPLAHKTLGTSQGGAVRVSFGIYNTLHETDLFYNAIRKILQERACDRTD